MRTLVVAVEGWKHLGAFQEDWVPTSHPQLHAVARGVQHLWSGKKCSLKTDYSVPDSPLLEDVVASGVLKTVELRLQEALRNFLAVVFAAGVDMQQRLVVAPAVRCARYPDDVREAP